MGRLLNVLAVIGGFAVAVFWLSSGDSASRLAVVTDVAPQGTARVGLAEAPRTTSQAMPSAPAAVQPAPLPAPAPVVATQRAPRGDAGSPRIGGGDGAGPDVTIAAPAARAPAQNAQSIAAPPVSTADLAARLQRELRRVGCYGGEITGEWSPASRRAMDSFVDRVNASLPTDRPDPVLLALVQNQRRTVCGATCPRGEVMTQNGRCLPRAVAAQPEPSRKQVAANQPPVVVPGPAPVTRQNWQVTTEPAPQAVAQAPLPPLPGRMGIGARTDADDLTVSLNGQPPAVVVYQKQPASAAAAPPPRPAPPRPRQASNPNRMPAWAAQAFKF